MIQEKFVQRCRLNGEFCFNIIIGTTFKIASLEFNEISCFSIAEPAMNVDYYYLRKFSDVFFSKFETSTSWRNFDDS